MHASWLQGALLHSLQLTAAEAVGHIVDLLLHLGHLGQPLGLTGLVVEQGGDGLQRDVTHSTDLTLGCFGEGDVFAHQHPGIASQIVRVVANTLDVARDGEEAADHSGALLVGFNRDQVRHIAGDLPVQKVDILLPLLHLDQLLLIPGQYGRKLSATLSVPWTASG